MHENSSRYVEIHNAIERHLKRLLRIDEEVQKDFPKLVHEAGRINRVVRRHGKALLEHNRLRNFVVHQHSHDSPLAIPSREAVDRYAAIRDLCFSPPRLIPRFGKRVETCTMADKIRVPAKKMFDGTFSQLPVIDDGVLVGLLTTETVTRWMANRLVDDGILLEETVGEVMAYREPTRDHEIMARDATVFDALDAFEKYNAWGFSLDAIIITESGKKSETPIGIVTVSDIPEMHKQTRV